MLVLPLGAGPPAEGPDDARGLDRRRFGWRLYDHFFKTYNEKLWGVPVDELPADFAAQRIKNLSLMNAGDRPRSMPQARTRRTSPR